jgi:hypothetical protein
VQSLNYGLADIVNQDSEENGRASVDFRRHNPNVVTEFKTLDAS